MKKCICRVKQEGQIGSNRFVLSIGAALHLFFIFGLTSAFSPTVGLTYLVLILIVLLVLWSRSIRKGHSGICALRSSLLRIMDFGTFISPF